MSWSINLFKVRGIQVKVHLTFVLILVWAAWNWSRTTQAGLTGALFGVLATLLLFAAVTLHELGHSFQALKYGVHVRGITLMPMGGVAQMEEIPEKPIQELRIAIAGPLVNFTIAALLIGLGALLQVRSVISLSELSASFGQVSWSGMYAYLTMANVALGLFNLIPAFPMDGGRVLRALLAMKLEYARATAIAVAVGQGLAWVLGLWGFMNGNYSLVLIAIFVWLGAGQEGRQHEVKNVLREFKVDQAMTREPHLLSTNDTLEKAVDLILSTSQRDFPVVQSDGITLAGILTEADVLQGLRAEGGHARVAKYARKSVPTVTPGEPLYTAQQRMAEGRVQAIPVVDSNAAVLGLLTATDANEAYRLLSTGLKLDPAST